jgi:hypothetical protein
MKSKRFYELTSINVFSFWFVRVLGQVIEEHGLKLIIVLGILAFIYFGSYMSLAKNRNSVFIWVSAVECLLYLRIDWHDFCLFYLVMKMAFIKGYTVYGSDGLM